MALGNSHCLPETLLLPLKWAAFCAAGRKGTPGRLWGWPTSPESTQNPGFMAAESAAASLTVLWELGLHSGN